MKKFFGFYLIFLALILFTPAFSKAEVGVGIGSGKIILNEDLTPGSIYDLPSVPVLNTGDEPADYSLSIQYNEVQPQIKPDADWFTFTPNQFHLEPGKSQLVKVSVTVPLKVVPGDYFAYVEAHPLRTNVPGVTTIGVAAASKLYFTIAPANFISGLYYRTLSLVKKYSPWTYVGFGIIVLLILVKIFRRFFNFKIALQVKNKE